MTNLEEILKDLHNAVAEELLERVRSGEATHNDLNVARQLLKDNSIQVNPDTKVDTPIFNLVEELPFKDDQEAVGQ